MDEDSQFSTEDFSDDTDLSENAFPNLSQHLPSFKQWKDRFAGFLFLIHILVVIGILIIGFIIGMSNYYYNRNDVAGGDDYLFHSAGSYYSSHTSELETEDTYEPDNSSMKERYNPYKELFQYFSSPLSLTEVVRIFSATVLCGCLGQVISVGWFVLTLQYPKGMIYMCLLYSVGICFVVSILFFTIGGWFIGILLVLVNILFFFCFFLWRKRMEFSAIQLKSFATILSQVPRVLLFIATVICLYFQWYMAWTAAILLIQQLVDSASFIVIIAFIYLIASWYWTLQVCKNIVHVGVAGFVAYWYCERPENAIIISRNMIYRCIVSFGSICLGSLLFPPIHIIRSLSLYLSRLSDYHPKLIGMQRSCAPFCEAILSIFHFANVYGLYEIAVFGKSLRSSSQSSLMILLSYGTENVLHDSLIYNMVGLGATMTSLITGLFASLGAWLLGSEYFFLVFLLTSFLGGSIFMLLSEAFYAAGIGLFLSACHKSPEKLRREFPELVTTIKNNENLRCLLVE